MKPSMALAVAVGVALAPIAAFAGDPNSRPECRRSPQLVAPCFRVHGRFYAANGTPGLRIWPTGTSRVLGVLDWNGDAEGRTIATPGLLKTMAARGFETRIYGDFEVCPLTKERAGWMQMVCIVRASRLAEVFGR